MEYKRPVHNLFPSKKSSISPNQHIGPHDKFNEKSIFSEKPPNLSPLRSVHCSRPLNENSSISSMPTDAASELAAKKLKLQQLKREMETLEFEILEMETKLQHTDKKPMQDDTLQTLLRKVSKLFMSGSTILTPASSLHALVSPKKMEDPLNSLHRKALNYFNNRLLPEVREKFDRQNTEFEQISRKGADIAKNILSSLSPTKKTPEFVGDSSYSLDHLGDLSLINTSMILSDDSVVDIDDYDSDSE